MTPCRLVVAVVLLVGCASPKAAPQAAPPAGVASSEIVQVITLTAPAGARGRLELTKTGAGHSGSGSIVVEDELGRWTFSYAPVAIEDAGKSIRLQALGVRVRTLAGTALAIDWDASVLIDSAGQRRPVNHRDELTAESDVAVWIGNSGLDALPRTDTATVVLTVREGARLVTARFVFAWRPPGETKPQEPAPPPQPRAIARWIGERFVVLPRPPARGTEPYEALEIRDKIGGHPAEEAAGAVLVVTAVKYDRVTPVVTFVREDTKQEYVGRAVAESVEGLAPLADIEAARAQWKGKTLWLAAPDLRAGSSEIGVVRVNRLAAVEVVDVQLGWTTEAPIRFVLKTTDGRTGFRDVHTTGTNVPDAQRKRHAFESAFLTDDPRTALDWPADVWAAIEASRVEVGMTAAQARMSWGEPRRIDRISGPWREERWIYPDRWTLVLVDDVVSEVHPSP